MLYIKGPFYKGQHVHLILAKWGLVQCQD
jgi:hypothetical protein